MKKTLIDMLSDNDLFKSLATVEFATLATGVDSRIHSFSDFFDSIFLIKTGKQCSHLMVKNKLCKALTKDDIDRLVRSDYSVQLQQKDK